MLYSVVGIDNENSLAARLSVRAEHVERLNALRDQGRLIIAGPNPAIDSDDPGEAGFSGSIIIAEFDSLQAAQSWADLDDVRVAREVAGVGDAPERALARQEVLAERLARRDAGLAQLARRPGRS